MDRDKWSARQERLCEHLKRVRVDANLTQVELADKLKRKQSYVSKYESGERRLDLFEIFDICSACDIKFSEFILRLETELEKYNKHK